MGSFKDKLYNSLMVVLFIFTYVIITTISDVKSSKKEVDIKSEFIKSFSKILPIFYMIYFYVCYMIYLVVIDTSAIEPRPKRLLYILFNLLVLSTFIGITLSYDHVNFSAFFFVLSIIINLSFIYYQFKELKYKSMYLHGATLGVLIGNLVYVIAQF